MGFSHEHILLGDIGATNARLALLSNGVLGPIKVLTVAEFPRFADAVSAFLDGHGRHMSAPEALLAAVTRGLAEVGTQFPGLSLKLEHSEHFRPGKPEPTHRITSTL